MDNEILRKLYANEQYLDYIRHHPKWYYYLDEEPSLYPYFENVVKKDLKLTTFDKLENLRKKINFASSFLKYMTKD